MSYVSAAPQVLGLPVATLALIVSLFSFAIAVAALIWQIVKHVLDGGRVKVYLNAAILEPDLMLSTNHSGRFLLQDDAGAHSVKRGRALELAQLVVENPGRLPVTVHSPGLAFSGHGKKRESIVPRLFGTNGAYGVDDAVTETVVRLEPFGRVAFLLDYWAVTSSILKDARKGRVLVRGKVGVGGRGNKPQMSSWRRRWLLTRGMYTAIEGSPELTPFAVIWGVMYRHLPTREAAEQDGDARRGRPITRESVLFVLDEAMSRFDERPARDQLEAALDEIAEKHGDLHPSFGFALLNSYESLDRMDGHLTEWTEGLLYRKRR
ncbi:hypothetical protein [Allobranchiibius sp. GilTou38]|uniref:hypothetical protein n=1 Tax=Allobranchiibius sp. GilTou38 TaxID=2815210 RepID=UPI001AA11736|nr:hypothetical protein [Allobranchiibius sp. GilTou38]MBO1765795.1 hypothetical protein [Allobranchiibius sp. GilTou38]